MLDKQSHELVTVQEELTFVESYVYLQKIRFGDNLKVELPMAGEGKVVPLSIQMLLENAIKHNEVSSENPLTIVIKREPDYLVVKNTVRLKPVPLEENSGLGLTNIQSRYEFLSDKALIINKSEADFEVKIPILKNLT